MWVKICANTNLHDARDAAEAGADAVGFVFAAGSKRAVTAEAVAPIARALQEEFPAVERIGVFDTEEAGGMLAAARAARLSGVQLHAAGMSAAAKIALVMEIQRAAPELTVLPVVHWEIDAADAGERVRDEVTALRAAGVVRVLLDAKVGAASGGMGVAFSWAAAARAMDGLREGLQLVVAGGLRPETVAEASRVLRPWGVDVASGVEESPGTKSGARVREFLAAARGQR